MVRVELFENGQTRDLAYINIEGSKSKGYRWYSDTEVLGCGGFEGEFRDDSQDNAIQRAIIQWKLRFVYIANQFTISKFPGEAE